MTEQEIIEEIKRSEKETEIAKNQIRKNISTIIASITFLFVRAWVVWYALILLQDKISMLPNFSYKEIFFATWGLSLLIGGFRK